METYNDGIDTAIIVIEHAMIAAKVIQKKSGADHINMDDFYTFMNKIKETIDQQKEQE